MARGTPERAQEMFLRCTLTSITYKGEIKHSSLSTYGETVMYRSLAALIREELVILLFEITERHSPGGSIS
jgi:hypothetical protein